MTTRRGRLSCRRLGVACMVLWAPAPLAAQSVRGWVGSTVQWVELRPLGTIDSACVPGASCYIAQPSQHSIVATQDAELTAWGFGVRGLSTTVLVRSRARLGSELAWPRTEDRFDAVLGYAQLVRGRLTARAGRQEIRSGLGFPSFDGASLAWYRQGGGLRLEGYGGRSLARGLREPVQEAFRGIEDFVPDQGVMLFGASARARLQSMSVTARYQREILRDRSGLASERGAVDVSLSTPNGRATGSLDYDFAGGGVGKAHVSWTNPLAEGRGLLELRALRYKPYFSLSTIWGFFEPVAYHGGEARMGWSPHASTAVWIGGGWRTYDGAGVATVLSPLTDTGKRAELGVRWQASAAATVDGAYRLEWGPGGYLSSGDGAVRWSVSEGFAVSVSATTFQQIEEFRLGDGRGWGGGSSVDLALTNGIRLRAGGSVLRHSGGGGLPSPWSQSRAWSSLRVLVGEDPGLANRRRR